MKRKSKDRSPLQLAADKRNWRLVQAAGVKTFFNSLGLMETGRVAYEAAVSEINLQWEMEKSLAKKS